MRQVQQNVRRYVLKNQIRAALETCPSLYVFLKKTRYGGTNFKKRVVTPAHDLMIEGYPRSGNSFAVQAMLWANGGTDSLNIATHVHSAAHVKIAVRYGIPTIVLIRDPSEAIPSLVALQIQSKRLSIRNSKEAEVVLKNEIKTYMRFYKNVLSVKNSIYLVPFDELKRDFGKVTKDVNQMFGSKFECFLHTKESLDNIASNSKPHVLPNSERGKLKAEIMEEYMSAKMTQEREGVEEFACKILKSLA